MSDQYTSDCARQDALNERAERAEETEIESLQREVARLTQANKTASDLLKNRDEVIEQRNQRIAELENMLAFLGYTGKAIERIIAKLNSR